MIRRCRKAGLTEQEFKLTDGFVITIRRKAGEAAEGVTPQVTPQVTRQVTRQVTEQVEVLIRLLDVAGRFFQIYPQLLPTLDVNVWSTLGKLTPNYAL
jgi:hypothetical protein